MNKPIKKTITYYDYYECQEYLEEKTGRDFRNYAGHDFSKPEHETPPYQDFWRYILEMADPFAKGRVFQMDDEWIEYEGAEDWQREIVELFLSEFGETDPDDGFRGSDCRIITFIADW